MDLNLTTTEQQFRDDFRAWLALNLPAEWTEVQTRKIVAVFTLPARLAAALEGGWAGISPREFGGRGASLMEQAIFQEELASANAPPLIGTIGLSLVGPTIIAIGTSEQKARYLAPILSGRRDLVSGLLETQRRQRPRVAQYKAVRDGDDFIINGQRSGPVLHNTGGACNSCELTPTRPNTKALLVCWSACAVKVFQ